MFYLEKSIQTLKKYETSWWCVWRKKKKYSSKTMWKHSNGMRVKKSLCQLMRSVRLLLSTLFVSCKAIKRTKGGTKTLLTFNLILLNNPKAEEVNTFSLLCTVVIGGVNLAVILTRCFLSALFCPFLNVIFPLPISIHIKERCLFVCLFVTIWSPNYRMDLSQKLPWTSPLTLRRSSKNFFGGDPPRGGIILEKLKK